MVSSVAAASYRKPQPADQRNSNSALNGICKRKVLWDVKRGKSVFVFGKSKTNKTSVRSEECSKRSGRK